MTTDLQTTINDGLARLGWLTTDWAEPTIGDFAPGDPLPVRVRWAGTQVIGAIARPAALIEVIVAPATDRDAASGVGVQAVEERLVQTLERIPGVFPRLNPSVAVYDSEIVPGSQRRYVVVRLVVLGDPL